MDKLKQWIALTLLGCLAIVGAGWFLLISPKRAEAETLRAQAAEQVAANSKLEQQLVVLRAQADDLPKKQADLARVSALIPDNPSLPALIRALSAASTSSGVQLVQIKPSEPVLPTAPVAAPKKAEDPTKAQQTPAVAPRGPADAAGQLATIPLLIEIHGEYYDMAQFLQNVEDLPRALRLMEVVVTTDEAQEGKTDGRFLKAEMNGAVFMAANRPPATPVVAPPTVPAK